MEPKTMPNRFETNPDDPEYIQLAAPLMEGMSPAFTAWLSDMFVQYKSGQAVGKAFCFAVGTLLALLAGRIAKPDKRDEFLRSMTENIFKCAQFADFPSEKKDPDASSVN
jgi:hypothetical protein